MIMEHAGATPAIHPTTRVAPNATVCGDVTIGPNCSIGFGVVLTAESGPIVLGANCVVMDTAVIRGVRGNPVIIGDNVLVGPRAYLTGCTVGENVFLATGSHRVQRRAHWCPGGGPHQRRCASADGPAGGCSGAAELDRRGRPG